MRHVVVMTATGSIGLVAIFVVDLLSLLYISWLGEPALTAGVGLATIVLFFAISINVGLMIAVGALVSRALGAGDPARAPARRLRLRAHGACRRGGHARAPAAPAVAARRSSARAPRRCPSPSGSSGSPAVERPHGARHGVLGHPARGRRRQARHVRDAVRRRRDGGARPAPDLRPRARHRRRRDRDRRLAPDLRRRRLWGASRIHRLVARPRLGDVCATRGRCTPSRCRRS